MAFLPEEGPGVSFDELYDAWRKIALFEEALENAEDELNEFLALCKQQCLVDRALWPDNQRPSMEYLKQVVHFIGNTPNDREHISQLRLAAKLHKENLTKAKGLLDKLQTQVRVWQTMSANARKALVVE